MAWTKFSEFLTSYGGLSLSMGEGDEHALRAAIKAFAEAYGDQIKNEACGVVDEILPKTQGGHLIKDAIKAIHLEPEMD